MFLKIYYGWQLSILALGLYFVKLRSIVIFVSFIICSLPYTTEGRHMLSGMFTGCAFDIHISPKYTAAIVIVKAI